MARLVPEGALKSKLKRAYMRFRGKGHRRDIAMSYYRDKLEMIEQWAAKDVETSNFYYGLTELNRDQLIHLVSIVTNIAYKSIEGYCRELDDDQDLRQHLQQALANSSYGQDIRVDYGRRLGWYAFARATKPAVVIETGVDHGVGACVLASALLRNRAEGYPGTYYGTEIRPEAGQLLSGRYIEAGKILYGDSIETLRAFPGKVDLFVNDSDHSANYEYREYETIVGKLSDKAIILGDNAHVTDSLSKFSSEQGRGFLFFREQPRNHWYPGAGIGISFHSSVQ